MSTRRRLGRAERALNRELRDTTTIGGTEAEALRITAHGLDLAEAASDLIGINALSKTYLDLRVAAGLSVRGDAARRDASGWDDLAAALSTPTVRDPAQH